MGLFVFLDDCGDPYYHYKKKKKKKANTYII